MRLSGSPRHVIGPLTWGEWVWPGIRRSRRSTYAPMSLNSLFFAVHESVNGTQRPWRHSSNMSAVDGKPAAPSRCRDFSIRPEAAFGSIHSTCLSALVTDRATEAWYHPPLHE